MEEVTVAAALLVVGCWLDGGCALVLVLVSVSVLILAVALVLVSVLDSQLVLSVTVVASAELVVSGGWLVV